MTFLTECRKQLKLSFLMMLGVAMADMMIDDRNLIVDNISVDGLKIESEGEFT